MTYMWRQVVELFVLFTTALNLLKLAQLRVVAPDNEQEIDYQVFEEIDKAQFKNVTTCFFENTGHRDLLDATIIPRIVFESRQIFLYF